MEKVLQIPKSKQSYYYLFDNSSNLWGGDILIFLKCEYKIDISFPPPLHFVIIINGNRLMFTILSPYFHLAMQGVGFMSFK